MERRKSGCGKGKGCKAYRIFIGLPNTTKFPYQIGLNALGNKDKRFTASFSQLAALCLDSDTSAEMRIFFFGGLHLPKDSTVVLAPDSDPLHPGKACLSQGFNSASLQHSASSASCRFWYDFNSRLTDCLPSETPACIKDFPLCCRVDCTKLGLSWETAALVIRLPLGSDSNSRRAVQRQETRPS